MTVGQWLSLTIIPKASMGMDWDYVNFGRQSHVTFKAYKLFDSMNHVVQIFTRVTFYFGLKKKVKT